jgi:hypothetical protein
MNRKIVIFQDSKDAMPAYFGPFVSDTIADAFVRDLPDPTPTGRVVVRSLEEYGRNDVTAITQSIMDMRKLPHRKTG